MCASEPLAYKWMKSHTQHTVAGRYCSQLCRRCEYTKKKQQQKRTEEKKMFLLNLNSVNERLQRHKFRVRWLNVCVLCVLFMFYFLVRTNVLREQTERFSCTTNQAETKTNTHRETRTEQTRARSLTTSDCLHTKAYIYTDDVQEKICVASIKSTSGLETTDKQRETKTTTKTEPTN